MARTSPTAKINKSVISKLLPSISRKRPLVGKDAIDETKRRRKKMKRK